MSIRSLLPALLLALVLPVVPPLAGTPLGSVAHADETDATAPPSRRDFTLTAHRGAPTRGVGENTIEAFRDALRAGATAIETDLRRTKDDEFVVLHDSGMGRTTNCGGPVGIWTLKAMMRQCREDKSGKPLPTGEELLQFVARTEATAMIELKGSNWSIRQVKRVVDLLKRSEVLDRVAISSLRVTVLQRVRRLAPALHTQLIVAGWPKIRASLGEVSGYNVPAGSISQARVARLHRKGLVVVGGYADSERTWRQAARLGLDGLVVPSVRRYRAWSRS